MPGGLAGPSLIIHVGVESETALAAQSLEVGVARVTFGPSQPAGRGSNFSVGGLVLRAVEMGAQHSVEREWRFGHVLDCV